MVCLRLLFTFSDVFVRTSIAFRRNQTHEFSRARIVPILVIKVQIRFKTIFTDYFEHSVAQQKRKNAK